MRTFDNGIYYSVLVSEREVENFARRWPCFGNVRAYWFQFDKRNGDLIDTDANEEDADGAGIVALAEDAMLYGARRLRLFDVLAIREKTNA